MARLDPKVLGEFGLIEAIRRRAEARGAAGVPRAKGWTRAIGDDAAILRPRAGHEIAITNDALVEDVHFRWRTTPARSLGRKALAVSLSDLGAMGARPLGFLLTLALPPEADPVRLDALIAGLLERARRAGCPLVGGDTVAGPVWMLATTAFGEVPRGRSLGRGGARAGDRLLVAGELGGSALGLHLLETGRARVRGAPAFVRRHLEPSPPFEVGARLARAGWARAAIDVSDGLVRDLGHVLAASGVGARVDVERLPLPRGMRALCASLGLDPAGLALGGGEDYALLFAAPKRAPTASRLAQRLGCAVREIGLFTREPGLRLERGGRPLDADDPARMQPGWDHFKPTPR